jgi:hypothetical protein
MLVYVFFKFYQEFLFIILIICVIIIINVRTWHRTIIFFSQYIFCSIKTRYSDLENWTIRFSQTDRIYFFFLNTWLLFLILIKMCRWWWDILWSTWWCFFAITWAIHLFKHLPKRISSFRSIILHFDLIFYFFTQGTR